MVDQQIIHATQTWLKSSSLPSIFARLPNGQQRNSIRYRVARPNGLENTLETLMTNAIISTPIDGNDTADFADMFADFDDYLDMLALAEQLLIAQGYEGIYQLASFHPTIISKQRPRIVISSQLTNRSPPHAASHPRSLDRAYNLPTLKYPSSQYQIDSRTGLGATASLISGLLC